jgi:hypothetical protein
MTYPKNLFLLFISFLSIPESFSAGNASLFYLDENKIYRALANASLVENSIRRNEKAFSEDETELIRGNGTPFYTLPGDTSETDIPVLGIPSFYWGFVPGFAGGFFAPCSYGSSCILGPSGVFMIYFMTDRNKEETRQSIYGCASGTALGAAVSITAIILFYGYLIFSLP